MNIRSGLNLILPVLLPVFLLPDLPGLAQESSPMKLIQNCSKIKRIRDKFKNTIQAPYVIDGCASKAILYGEPGQEAVIPVSVLGKQRYRIYFQTEGFEKPVFVKVCTLNKKVVFSNESDPSVSMFAFTATRTEKYFVEFFYTQSNNPDAVGCASVVIASREF
jgi:hypothetical protein